MLKNIHELQSASEIILQSFKVELFQLGHQ